MKKLFGFIVLSLSLVAYAADNSSMKVAPDQTSFVVTLAANPTTGYQWSVVEYNKELLVLTSSEYQKPQTSLIGAGGQMKFTFTLIKGKTYPASTQIQFKYARPWESDGGRLKNITVNFVSS